MLNYGDIAFHYVKELEEMTREMDIHVFNCGFYIAGNSESTLTNFETNYLIVYQHKGNATVKQSGKTYMLKSGDIFIFPENNKPDVFYHPDEINERYYIYFNGVKVKEIFKEFNLTCSLYHVGNFPEFIDATHLLLKVFHNDPYKNAFYKKVLLLNVLARIDGYVSSQNATDSEADIIKPAVTHMQKNFKSKILPIEKYAQMCYISKVTLIKYFKLALNTTPSKYFYNLKIENAIIQLTNSNKNVNEIAYDLSFTDPLYFSRVFKSHVGCSPKEYRKYNDRFNEIRDKIKEENNTVPPEKE